MTDVSSKITILIELAKAYFPLAHNTLIERHDELLRIMDIKSTKHEKHPHQDSRVYISRRALKHFVEKRKAELSKYHKEEDSLLKICSAIEQIPEIIVNFDKYEYEYNPEKHFYIKHYSGEPSIRVLCEISKEHTGNLEICSLHFTKSKKDK